MLRLLVGKLRQPSSLSPPSATTLFHLLVPDQSSPTAKPSASSRGFSSKPDCSSTSDSPLSTLISYGVPEEQASSILAKLPALRNSDPVNILKPKLDFLLNAGFTGADMAEVFVANPQILSMSLERSIAPSVHFLKTLIPSKDAWIQILKYTNMLLTPKNEANIKLLEAHGVPEAMIVRLLRYQPRALARRKEDFVSALGRVKELGLDPTTCKFVIALGVLSYMSRSSFQRKVDLYRELGWSEEAVYAMFKRMPECMTLSDENIKAKMGYFMEKLRWDPESLKMNPKVLGMNLDKKIIPRCAVLNLLMVKGLLRKNAAAPSMITASERIFYENYVRKYQEQVPEVVKAHEGKITFQGWERFKDDENSSNSRKP